MAVFQVLALLVWLLLMFVGAAVVNYFAKRPLANPWLWLAATYAGALGLGVVIGLVRGTPQLGYRMGTFIPITVVAVVLGVWRAPKWRAAHPKSPTSEENANAR